MTSEKKYYFPIPTPYPGSFHCCKKTPVAAGHVPGCEKYSAETVSSESNFVIVGKNTLSWTIIILSLLFLSFLISNRLAQLTLKTKTSQCGTLVSFRAFHRYDPSSTPAWGICELRFVDLNIQLSQPFVQVFFYTSQRFAISLLSFWYFSTFSFSFSPLVVSADKVIWIIMHFFSYLFIMDHFRICSSCFLQWQRTQFVQC